MSDGNRVLDLLEACLPVLKINWEAFKSSKGLHLGEVEVTILHYRSISFFFFVKITVQSFIIVIIITSNKCSHLILNVGIHLNCGFIVQRPINVMFTCKLTRLYLHFTSMLCSQSFLLEQF